MFQQAFTIVWLECNLAMLYFLKNCFSDPIPQWTNLRTYHSSRKYEKTPLTRTMLFDDTSMAAVSALAKHWSPGRWQACPQSPTAAEGAELQLLLPSSTTSLGDPQLIILRLAQIPYADLGQGTSYPKHSPFFFNHCHKKGLSCWYSFVKFQKELKPNSFFFPPGIHRCECRPNRLTFFTENKS